jgi:hypothetical protein
MLRYAWPYVQKVSDIISICARMLRCAWLYVQLCGHLGPTRLFYRVANLSIPPSLPPLDIQKVPPLSINGYPGHLNATA